MQIFAVRASRQINGETVYEKSYTIDEYRALFDAYYSSVTKALTNAQEDLASKQNTLTEMQKPDGLTDEEAPAIADAESALERAQADYDTLNTKLTEAINAETLAEKSVIGAATAVDDARIEWNAKREAALTAQGELVEANIDAAVKEAEDTKEAVDKAQADGNASGTEVTNAEIAEAEAQKKAAEEAERIAEEAVDKCQKDLDAANEALDA